MRKHFFISLLLLPLCCFSQSDTAFATTGFNKAYFKSYFIDTRDILVSPFKAKPKQWFTFLGIAAADIAIATQDGVIRNFVLKNRNPTTRLIQEQGLERLGSGVYSMPLLGAFYLYGSLKDDERSKQTALLGLKSFIISGFIVTLPKQFFHRHRPCPTTYARTTNSACMSDSPYLFDGLFNFEKAPNTFKDHVAVFFQSSNTSFPSGHSTSAFAIATVIAEQYKHKKWVSVLSYSLAALTGLSRIEANKHWASDVFLGAVLGYSVGKFVTRKKNWKVKTLNEYRY